ncbi:aquaporin NIP1-1-like [Amaranthus tricolor]|uniref:aquaporin NIP1-1-like n=1 Tax=Amaranthus tricolor TaxID=29722 RepID=UPI00258FD444|nr:aquaporin NIP1-1-like [Amaranthus tricolor]
MGEVARATGNNHEIPINLKDGDLPQVSPINSSPSNTNNSDSCFTLPFLQKMIAEMMGTYFLIFAGCAAITVNLDEDKVVTLPGIAIVWGLAVMVMVYAVGHISGCHINPAVTIAFATSRRFPWKQVPAYVICQVVGSTLASGTLRLIFNGHQTQIVVSAPSGSDLQSFVVEFITTFYLMFVISGVATDNRAIGELAGLAIGATVLLNVLFSAPISSASMNPARSLGPAIISNHYKGVWIYLIAPTAGAIAGAMVYNLIRFTDKPLREITKTGSFLKSKGSSRGRTSWS